MKFMHPTLTLTWKLYKLSVMELTLGISRKSKTTIPSVLNLICALFLNTTYVIGAEPYLSQDYLTSDTVYRI